MNKEKKLLKTWLGLFSIASLLFAVVGSVMVVIDREFILGSQYILTSILFITATMLIKKGKIKPNLARPRLSLGFIFSVVGLTSPSTPGLHIGLWAFGIILFISGLFNKD